MLCFFAKKKKLILLTLAHIGISLRKLEKRGPNQCDVTGIKVFVLRKNLMNAIKSP